MRKLQAVPCDRMAMSRRKVLFSGLVMAAGGVIGTALPRFSLADADKNTALFMRVSRLLVNHQLSDAVGVRMLAQLAAEHAELVTELNHLLAIASEHHARRVEDFFPAIPAGELQDLAYKIIFGWYTGSLKPERTAKVFAYEQALTWHTTMDVIAIPSYGISGPNRWQRINAPVLPVPQF
ncbi:hypothetical protein B5M10_02120 [Pluralibacter gergoviae]|nr:hypothetical protein SS31_10270 [Pluralibacter gergoviae]OUR04427.1 hypothetical protein B5M10_02120 [Pluralibacter gergoviae]